MNKVFKRFLCVFLSVLMIVQITPMSAFAKDIVQKQTIEATAPQSSDNDDIIVETEIESMRTENSKTFITADNGYYQVTSALPLHNNVDGEWVDKTILSNTEINTISDVEEYVDEQIQVSLSAQSEENEPTKTITSNGDTYVDNCQTQIGTYSSSGTEDLSVIYARVGKATSRAEIYIKPYFPTDHAIFVTDAKIKATIYDENIVGDYNLVEVDQITDEWSPGAQDERLTAFAANYDLVEIYSNGENSEDPIIYNFDFTNYCNYTRIGLIENYGVVLTAGDIGTNLTFENLTVEMYYHEIEDVDSSFEYEQIDIGRGGKIYINDYTCSPVLVRDELSLYGEIAPVSVQTIFNPMDDIDDIGFGKHTRINYYSTLTYDENSNVYLWKNCEGENLYFTKIGARFEANGADNIKYTLTGAISNDENGNKIYNNIKITDSNNKSYRFSSYNNKGYLISLTDGSENDNAINIEYSDINNLHTITSVTDGAGRKYLFSYNNGHLSNLSVVNSDNEPIYIKSETGDGEVSTPIQINYSYQNDLLQQVSYADGKSIQYTYGSDEKLSAVTNVDNSKIDFTYESKFDGESYKLSQYVKFDSNNNQQEKVEIKSIDQSIYNRAFSSSLYSTKKELTFDRNFNMIRLKSYSGIEYFLNYSNNELQYILTADTVAENFVKNGDFEEVANGRPTDWNYEVTDNSTISQNTIALDDNASNRTLNMDNFMDTCRAYQIVEKTGYTFEADKSYILSGFIYRNDSPIAISDTRDLCIYVYDTKTDENGATVPDTCLTKMDFDDTLGEEWQQRKTIFTAQKDTSSLIIYLSYNNMMSTCDFDNIEIYEATVKNAIDAQSIIPSNDIEYDYSENNSILEEIKTTVDGDELGTFYNYTDDENYISKITNNGIATYYDYDENNGLLLSKGNNSDASKNTQYSYTAVGLLEYVKQVSTQIDGTAVSIDTKYSYENDRIKTVEHNGFIYEYEYDSNGRVVGISQYATTSTAKSQLVSYNYINNDIDTITYGNGAKILYEYNQLEYITKITHVPAVVSISDEDTETAEEAEPIVYEYTYDEYGNVLSYTDNSNNTVTTIDDDTYTVKEKDEDGAVIYQNDGSTKTFFGVKTTIKDTSLPPSSGKTTDTRVFSLYENKLLPTNIITATTVYDSVGRTFSTTATDKSAVVKNECTYVNSGIKTSNLINTYISSVTKVSTSSEEARVYRKLTYTYNDRGQITDIYRASVNNIPENVEGTSTSVNQLKNELLKHYEYDEAGQVILDVNFDSCIAIKYK